MQLTPNKTSGDIEQVTREAERAGLGLDPAIDEIITGSRTLASFLLQLTAAPVERTSYTPSVTPIEGSGAIALDALVRALAEDDSAMQERNDQLNAVILYAWNLHIRRVRETIRNRVRDAFMEQLEDSSTKDSLTRLSTQGRFRSVAPKAFNVTKEAGRKLTYFIADIDRFHDFNAKYGHDAGDEVLREIGALLRKFLRPGDLRFQYSAKHGRFKEVLTRKIFSARDGGGEEFSNILIDTDLEGGKKAAERLRDLIEKHPITIINKQGNQEVVYVTVSIGVAEADFDRDEDFAALKRRADTVLLMAKDHGRNAVMAHTYSATGDEEMKMVSPEDRLKPGASSRDGRKENPLSRIFRRLGRNKR